MSVRKYTWAKNFAKITLGIKIVWKFISEGVSYRTTSFSAMSYYLGHGIFIERTRRKVVLYERS